MDRPRPTKVVSLDSRRRTPMSDAAERLPFARNRDELLVEQLPDELLVFDRVNQQGHCLNRIAAIVWERCDGVTTVAALAAALEAAGIAGGREVVVTALAQLQAARLVAAPPEPEPVATSSARAAGGTVARRRALKRIGLIAGAALAFPLVQSIVAPSVAEACSAT